MVRAQPGLYMADGDSRIEGREGPGKGRRRVALHQHQRGALFLEKGRERLEQTMRNLRRALRLAHHVQIVFDRKPEKIDERVG